MVYICTINRLLSKKLSHCKYFCQRNGKKKPPWNVLFFGTDKFSLFSLKNLYSEYRKGNLVSNLEVVTCLNTKQNLVQKFAKETNLTVHHWPISENICVKYDVGIVVSFGHLISEKIITAFPLGMINVHASLLPRWRGAAPIIYALANGDSETGISIMRIKPKVFDVGDILRQECVKIEPNVKLMELHDKLGEVGANALIKSLENLTENLKLAQTQPSQGVTFAPKVTSKFAKVDWEKQSPEQICNLERAVYGLFPLTTTWKNTTVKLFNVQKCTENVPSKLEIKPGFIEYDRENKLLRILCANGQWITVEKIGILGKKTMSARDFNNGYLKKEPSNCRYFK